MTFNEQDLSALSSKLDPSQEVALRQALQNRVALIQGPPGTGKTYTGMVWLMYVGSWSQVKFQR